MKDEGGRMNQNNFLLIHPSSFILHPFCERDVMRYLAIGDIHGYADVLQQLLEAIALRPEDQVIALGDYVDRGPDSRGVIEQLLKLRDTGQLVALRGNHDFMMLEARGRFDI